MTNRELTYRFLELPHVLQQQIVKELKPGKYDEPIVNYFRKARDNNLLGQMQTLIERKRNDI